MRHSDCLAGVLARAAQRHPDATAVDIGARQLTFAAWHRDSAFVAAALASRFDRGDAVGLTCARATWPELVIGYIGAQLAGLLPVPIDAGATDAERTPMLKQAACRDVVSCDDDPHSLTIAELIREGAAVDAVEREPLDHADVIFTSGTTGRPRGVVSRFADLLAGGRLPATWAGRALFHCFPPSSGAGVHGAMLLALRSGMELRSASNLSVLDGRQVADAVCAPSVAALYLLPAVAEATARALQRQGTSHVRMVMLTAAASRPATLQAVASAFPTAAVVNLYGATEAGLAQTFMVYDALRPTALGRPLGRTEVGIRVDGRWAATGVEGEVCLRRVGAPQRAYVGVDASDARSVFLPGGWVATGDLGYVDRDGYLHLLDRLKDVIIRGGQNISASEIEDVMRAHRSVADAAVVGAPARAGETIVAFVTLRRDADAADLRAHVAATLSAAKVPQRVVVVDDLPRNAAGKVLKTELRRQLLTPREGTP